MAEVFSGLWLILIVVLMGSLAEAVPLSVIAGILAVVAMELIWARIPDARLIWKTSKGLAATGLLTFGSALFIPLQYTIFLGEGLSMILYIYASGMEHAEEAGDIAADEFSIPDQFFHGLGRRLEKGVIGNTLMASEKATNLLRDGEGDHEIWPRNLSVQLPIHPVQRLLILACRAVAVAAGAKNMVVFSTPGAFVYGHAACRCSA